LILNGSSPFVGVFTFSPWSELKLVEFSSLSFRLKIPKFKIRYNE
jgi:hypothetical protein